MDRANRVRSITFRPHHFMCALGFVGKGYSPAFVKNFSRILAELKEGADDLDIEVIRGLDHICAPCPHHNQKTCSSQPVIDALDEAHQKILALSVGERLTWKAAKARIKAKMTFEKFHEACAPCEWKALGVCEAKLKALLSEP